MKKTTSIKMSLLLGRQVERVRVRKHDQWRFTAVAGGATFASLFPSLVGKTLEISNRGLELVTDPVMMQAVGWLSANGYFLRGGLQK